MEKGKREAEKIKPYRSEARKVRPSVFREKQRKEIEKILDINLKQLDFDFHKQLEWEVKQFHMDRVFQEGDNVSGPYPKPHQTRDQLKEFHKAANKFIHCLEGLDDITLMDIQDADREWTETLIMQLKIRVALADRPMKCKGKPGEKEDEALNNFIFRLAILYKKATGKDAKRIARGECADNQKNFPSFSKYIIEILRQIGVKKEYPGDYLYSIGCETSEALDERIRRVLKRIQTRK